jgi:DNA-binding MarR family transcriptional regulator
MEERMIHYQYGRYIAKIYRSFQMFLKVRLEEAGLRPLEFRILLWVLHEDGAKQEDLAEGLGVDKSIITRMVKSLMQKGYLTREVNKMDRRAYCLHRTVKAEAFDGEMRAILDEWESIILTEVPEAERMRFSELLKLVSGFTMETVKEIRQEV